jgi:hypothetical protein
MKEHSIIKLGGGHFTCSKCGKTVFGSTKHRCNMIPESKLKEQCTPDVIKKMVELAEGFEFYENEEGDKYYSHKESEWIPILVFNPVVFPLLIHRAVGGWNNKDNQSFYIYMGYRYISKNYPEYDIRYAFKNYQPSSFTPCECACLHCLIEVLK